MNIVIRVQHKGIDYDASTPIQLKNIAISIASSIFDDMFRKSDFSKQAQTLIRRSSFTLILKEVEIELRREIVRASYYVGEEENEETH